MDINIFKTLLSEKQFSVLNYLSTGAQARVVDISRDTGIHIGHVHGLVKSLEKRGLVSSVMKANKDVRTWKTTNYYFLNKDLTKSNL